MNFTNGHWNSEPLKKFIKPMFRRDEFGADCTSAETSNCSEDSATTGFDSWTHFKYWGWRTSVLEFPIND